MMEDATNGEGMSCGWWLMVSGRWLWTPKTRFDISQQFFSQESQKWNTCIHMPTTDYLNSRPTTISLSKTCFNMFFRAFLMALGTRAWWRAEWTFFAMELEVGQRTGSVELTSCRGMLCLKLGRSLRWGWIIWTRIQVTPRVFLLQIQHGPCSSWLVPEERLDFQPPFLVLGSRSHTLSATG